MSSIVDIYIEGGLDSITPSSVRTVVREYENRLGRPLKLAEKIKIRDILVGAADELQRSQSDEEDQDIMDRTIEEVKKFLESRLPPPVAIVNPEGTIDLGERIPPYQVYPKPPAPPGWHPVDATPRGPTLPSELGPR